MLGSLAEAEDVMQDAYMRWHEIDRPAVDAPAAFLRQVVVRLCLDRLKSARTRREAYVGAWLPEPVVDEAALHDAADGERTADISFALMLALERLSPLERAAFLLHDVFDLDFAEIAVCLGRRTAACRQLAARARANVRAGRPRFNVPPPQGEAVLTAFMAAAQSGDATALGRLLAEDAVLHADGGGRRITALNPIRGRSRIIRLLASVARKGQTLRIIRRLSVNGLPGALAVRPDGGLEVLAIQIDGAYIAALYLVSNPDKLRHLVKEAKADQA